MLINKCFTRFSYLLLLALLWTNTSHAQEGLLISPTTYDWLEKGVIFKAASSNKGLLLPRVALTSVNSASPVVSPANGLLVFNTNAGITGGYGTGFYYWWNTQWLALLNEDNVNAPYWKINGNSGTNPAIHFAGTTTNHDIIFISRNMRAGFIGLRNTSFGDSSYNGNTGIDNSSLGFLALLQNTTGSINNSLGAGTLEKNTTGNHNVACGSNALGSNTTGSSNVVVGYENTKQGTGANMNTALGTSDGNENSTRCVSIGYSAGANQRTNAIALGTFSKPDCNNCAVLGGGGGGSNSSFKVGIGTSSPAADLDIRQSTGITAGIRLTHSGGAHNWRFAVDNFADLNYYKNGALRAYIEDVSGDYTVVSDRRLKKEIRPLQNDILSKLVQLNAKSYRYKHNDINEPYSIGFLAQEVKEIFPDFVIPGENGMLGIDYHNFSVIAIKAIQEQQKQIEDREKMIDALTRRLDKLEAHQHQ